MKLKTKLSFGLSFLFLVILAYGILSIFYIYRLSADSKSVLKNNLESLLFCNNMLKALEEIPSQKEQVNIFERNLQKQEANITEAGEADATKDLRKNFSELLQNPADTVNYGEIRQSIQAINDFNQQAILRKNAVAKKTSDDAILWLSLIFAVLALITFTFVVNFPAIISTPIRALNDGISEIAGKNYGKRIFLKQHDEFGDLANAFNSMAEKLDQYENSNLAQLRFEKSRIETIINQMKDGIIGLDAKKNILFLNTVAENLLGLSQAEIIGKYVADVAVKNDLMRSLIQEDASKELKIFADGKESYFNKDILSVTNSDKVIGEVIILRNITLFHELNEAKTNFIATVSHELKTPIASIKMSLQLLENKQVGELNAEQNTLVESIKEDAGRLLKITGELLNMAQVESGTIQMNLVPSDITSIIDYAVNANKSAAEQKQVSLKVEVPGKLPMVMADNEKTSWVLTNLVSNAIRYSYDNSVVYIRVTEENKKIKFTVTDTGQGISPQYIDKVFNRYFRIPGTKKEGTGLGLSISKEFIEAQGGQITVKSDFGEGSSFAFTLNPVPASA